MDERIAIENLVVAREAFKAVSARYFLIDGTLLGIVRDGHLIEWDTDMDIGVLGEDFTLLSFARFMFMMRNKGFSLRFMGGSWKQYFQCCWSRNGVKFDLFFYFRHDDRRVTYSFDRKEVIEYSYPASLIEILSPIEFFGETFTAPRQKEAVLACEYGDWQTPQSDWDSTKSPPNITSRRKRTRLELLKSTLTFYVLRRIWNATEPTR